MRNLVLPAAFTNLVVGTAAVALTLGAAFAIPFGVCALLGLAGAVMNEVTR